MIVTVGNMPPGADGGASWRTSKTPMTGRMAAFPIAQHTDAANAQHYEVPAAFFGAVLGPRRKYSRCLYETGFETRAQAESLAHRRACGAVRWASYPRARLLMRRFTDLFTGAKEWTWNGLHHERTAEDRLLNFDIQRNPIRRFLKPYASGRGHGRNNQAARGAAAAAAVFQFHGSSSLRRRLG
jgi:cyclopropane fatty-acyl-phospholipid synthase-like methyltransferase